MTNTDDASNKTVATKSTGGFTVPASRGALADNVAKLEGDLAAEREERSEERFIWIAVVFILTAGHVYASMDSLTVFLVLFLLSLILLVGIAKRLGVDWAVQSVGWLMHWIASRASLGKD